MCEAWVVFLFVYLELYGGLVELELDVVSVGDYLRIRQQLQCRIEAGFFLLFVLIYSFSHFGQRFGKDAIFSVGCR